MGIKNRDNALYMATGIDNSGLAEDAEQGKKIVKDMTNSIVQEGSRIKDGFAKAEEGIEQGVRNASKNIDVATASLNDMEKALNQLRDAYRQLNAEQRNSAIGQSLLTQMGEAYVALTKINAQMANSAALTKNLGGGYNALFFQTQQLVRELPSATMGLSMFIMAISNNLPMFSDALKEANEQIKIAKANNQQTVPIWKQLAGAIFNWQTALVAAVTTLILYGKDIQNFIAELFNSKEAVDSLSKSIKDLTDARQKGEMSAQQEIVRLRSLYQGLRDETMARQDRVKIAKELQTTYPSYFGNLTTEQMLTGKLTTSYNNLVNAIYKAAKARAVEDVMVENNKKNIELRGKLAMAMAEQIQYTEALTKAQNEYDKKAEQGFGSASDKLAAETKVGKAEAIVKRQQSLIDDLFKQRKTIVQSNESLSKEVSPVNLIFKEEDKNKSNDKLEHQAEKLREQTDKYKILLSSQALEEKRAAEDLQTSVEEARIKSMTDGSEKFIAQMELNFEKEMQAIDREKEDVLRKKIDDARSTFEANPKNKGKSFDASGISLSNTEITAFDEKYKAVIAGFDKDNNAQRVSELQMMWDYLKEYGTIQQQKLAIAEEYNEKIAKSTDEWQKKSLEAERDAKITSIETDAIKANIDWTTVFSEFGGMFSDVIKPALEEAKKYAQTDKFKNSDQASQKTLIDAINQMEKTIGGTGTLNFKKLGQDIKVYQAAEQNRIQAVEEETRAIEARKKAQENYDKALKDGTDQQKKSAQEALNNAQNNETIASANVKVQTDIANRTQQGVTDTATKLKNTMDNVVEGLSQMASGSISNAYQGFITATKDAKGALGKLSESLSSVPIVGWILSIIDVLKDGLSNLVGNLIDSVLNAVSGIIKDVFSGDLFVTLFKSLTSGTGKIINALSFGLHGKIMNEFTNSNAKEVAETTNKLTSSNEVLKRSIDALKDEMEKARGADTVRVYDEALKKQKELIENTGDVLAAQMGYHSSHHSNDYYIDKSMSRDDWQRISDRTGKQVSSTSDLWNLSPEDLKKVSTLTDIWDKIYNGGKYDKSGYIDQYLELADTLGQLETQLQETLTQTTFDSVYDNFVDTLMDMNKSAEDFADDLSKVFMKAILSNQIGQEYATKLEEWYKKFAKDMEDGTLTDEEREVLKNEYMSYVDAAIKERDELAKTIGYNSDNEDESGVTGKLQAALTEGTANEVLGVINMSALDLRTLKGLTAEHFKDYATEMNYISNLVDEARQINVNTKRTADNTDGLIDKLDTGFKGLKNELAEIKKNTKDTSGR